MDCIDGLAKYQLWDSSGGSLVSLQMFDLLYKVVNEAVKYPLIGLPPQMTWLKNIERPVHDDE